MLGFSSANHSRVCMKNDKSLEQFFRKFLEKPSFFSVAEILGKQAQIS
ncbi:hypothetical protein AmDm5_1674 [Acetobacter malorum]|nr:hypothetical protein AmDm5_1674 [Acetobacter malorum]